jgi:hypothetical protein
MQNWKQFRSVQNSVHLQTRGIVIDKPLLSNLEPLLIVLDKSVQFGFGLAVDLIDFLFTYPSALSEGLSFEFNKEKSLPFLHVITVNGLHLKTKQRWQNQLIFLPLFLLRKLLRIRTLNFDIFLP